MDNFSKLHTYAKIMYDQGVQDFEKHFVEYIGVRSQHEENKEDFAEGGGPENNIVMVLQNSGHGEN
jgi:hypothetical protein